MLKTLRNPFWVIPEKDQFLFSTKMTHLSLVSGAVSSISDPSMQQHDGALSLSFANRTVKNACRHT